MRNLASRLLLTGCLSLASIAQATEIDVQKAATHVMQQYNIPGMAIAVTRDGQQTFYNFGVAARDTGQAVSSDTLFELGSISKTFTATLATYAQANGQLSLDDHPGKYFPQLKGSAFDKVTLLNLATHTAGGFPLQVPDEVQNTEQLMAYLKAWQPQYPAGTQRTYANPSIGMLGMITAASMQMPFETAMEQRLLPKLGLRNTYLKTPASQLPLYAQGYDKQDAPIRLKGGVLGNEAYGMKSSSRDLLHFVEANITPGTLEPALGRAIAQTKVGYFRSGALVQDLVWEQYGYPVKLEALLEGNSARMVTESHAATAIVPPLISGGDVWINKTGSTNGFGGYVAFVPSKKLGVVILANKNYPNEARVRLAYEVLGGTESER